MQHFPNLASLVILLVLAAAAMAGDVPALVPAAKTDYDWKTLHKSYVDAAQAGGIDVLFIGDSLTEYWGAEGQEVWKKTFEPLKAAHFGIAADRLENILWRLQNGELDKPLKPKVVVLLGGINNSWGTKREDNESRGAFIGAGVAAVVKTIREKLPETKILVLAIFPLGDGMAPPVKLANEAMARLKDDKMVFFLDLGPKLSDQAGNLAKELDKDGTHLTAKGYQVWADAMQETLQKLLR